MSITIYPNSQQFWSGSGTTDSNVILGEGGTVYVGDFYLDTNTYNLYNFTSLGSFDSDTQTYTGCTFEEIVNKDNILSVILSLGWNLNTSRSYSLRSSPSFNTSYIPSTTNDVIVISSLSLTSTLLTQGTVQFQVNSGSGYTTIAEVSISGIEATNIQTINCLVSSNSSYKLLNSSGTATIISINEISM